MEVVKQVKYENRFGETMTLKLDDQNNVWFNHTDCNEDFENISDLFVDYKIKGEVYKGGFKYVLDQDEKAVLSLFLEDVKYKAPEVLPLIEI